MTLGGLALAVGMLVDDAIVAIENIYRNLGLGKQLRLAIVDGTTQITVPTLVATTAICIVFVPILFLGGAAGSLFKPLALAVVYAMAASYLLSRTFVPVMVHLLLKKEASMHQHGHEDNVHNAPSRDIIWRAHRVFNRYFDRFLNWYRHRLCCSMQSFFAVRYA
jgi:multidrug efflux pump subunit AcrB